MSTASTPAAGWLAPYLARWQAFWNARTAQERTYLRAAFAVVLLAIVWLLLLEPAIEGRARLEKSLPQLRQQNAQMAALAVEAQALGGAQANAVPATREALEQMMARHGLRAESLAITGEFARVQFNGVAFAQLTAWLDEAQRVARVGVQEASVSAQPTPGTVNASLTLRLARGE